MIVTLCKKFPATHPKAGVPTEFESKLKSGTKIHTIRHNAKGVWDERYKGISSGRKYLSVREWTGRPYNSEQREFARFEEIGLQHFGTGHTIQDADRLEYIGTIQMCGGALVFHVFKVI